VYAVDRSNHQIKKFNRDGGFIFKWGTNGTENGQFTNPTALGVDGNGNVYVSESYRVQKFH